MESLKPPSCLVMSGNVGAQWKKFKQNFLIFLKATGSIKKPSDEKVAILLNVVGDEAVELFNTFELSEEDSEDFEKVIEKFEEYMLPKKNIVAERYIFNTKYQQEGETFLAFLTEIKKLVVTCEYGDQQDSVLVDRIVLGIRDKGVQERLLRVKDATLDKVIELCKADELSKSQAELISGKAVNVIGKKQFKMESERKERLVKYEEVYSCYKCGRKHKRMSCPAYGQRCMKCNNYNHFAVGCKFRGSSGYGDKKKQVYEVGEDDTENVLISQINIKVNEVKKGSNKKEWCQVIKVGDKTISFKIDSGSEVNVVPLDVVKSVGGKCVKMDSGVCLEAFGGSVVKPMGKVTLTGQLGDAEVTIEAWVTDKSVKVKPILGLETCIKLGLIKRVEVNVMKELCTNGFVAKNKELFEGVGKLKTKCEIRVLSGVVPVVKPPRRVPFALRDTLKTKLEELVAQQIIVKVESPRGWVSNLVITEKTDGSLRLCLDPQELNKAVIREYVLIPTIEDITSVLKDKAVFSVLDLKDGFYHLELEEKSSHLCTFSTPFGCYRFKRLPFGIACAPELFHKVNENNFANIEGVSVYFDDVLIAAKSEEEHDLIMDKVLERARELNIKFNPAKVQYRAREVKYLGHLLSKEGMKPDPEQVTAIEWIQEPKNRGELQKILGMINYIRSFIPKLSEMTAPLRELLKKHVEWQWLPVHAEALLRLKKKVTGAPVLGMFDPREEVVIQSDSSKDGLGCCLMQKKRPIAYASRSLTETEKGYAQIEKELLSVVFAVSKFHNYVYGRKVISLTDHKPLVAIMRKQVAAIASKRLQRLKLKLLKYELEVRYLPGKEMYIADLLSRSFNKEEVQEDPAMAEVVHILGISHRLQVSDERKREIKEETQKDEVLKQLMEYDKEGWPAIQTVEKGVKRYYKLRQEIHVDEGLVFLGEKLIVPKGARMFILKQLHEGHMGMDKTKVRARQVIYWPGMSCDIEKEVASCRICEKYGNANRKEPLEQHAVPELPFEKVAADLLDYGGKTYMVVVDYLSKWLEVKQLRNKQSQEVINNFESIFSTHGVPKIIMSDNMPFASRECRLFARQWDIQMVTSSPGYPRSNGLAERAVQTAKSMLRKCTTEGKSIDVALLEYRNSPITGLKVSPAQVLMSRRLRSKLPVSGEMLKPQVQEAVKQQLEEKQQKSKKCYDRSTQKLRPLEVGEDVVIRKDKIWVPGKVVGKHELPRSYWVRDERGQVVRRNRFHLKASKSELKSEYRQELEEEERVEEREPAVVERPGEQQVKERPKRDTKKPVKFNDYIMD